MLIARATSKRVRRWLDLHSSNWYSTPNCFQPTWVCVSYSTAWRYLLQLTTEAKYDRAIQKGKWLKVFDNDDFQQRVRYERQGNNQKHNKKINNTYCLEHHLSVMNLTLRLAVCIQYLPGWEFDWADKKPQMSRESLTLGSWKKELIITLQVYWYMSTKKCAAIVPVCPCTNPYSPTF